MSSLDAALAFARRGVAVLPVWAWTADGLCRCGRVDPKDGPCRSGKHPVGSLVPHGLVDATTDLTRVRRWWRPGAHHGVAVRTGSPFWVLDEDDAGAADALGLPITTTSRTPSGGRHFWFRGEGVPSTCRTIPGCDTRGVSGYAVVPPTPGYAWLVRAPVAVAPATLLARLAPPAAPSTRAAPVAVPRDHGGSSYGLAVLRRACERAEAARAGTRHSTLRAQSRLIAGFVSGGELEEGLARRCLASAGVAAGLPEREVEAVVAWGFARGLGEPLARPRRR
jgi:hypothetical protein